MNVGIFWVGQAEFGLSPKECVHVIVLKWFHIIVLKILSDIFLGFLLNSSTHKAAPPYHMTTTNQGGQKPITPFLQGV